MKRLLPLVGLAAAASVCAAEPPAAPAFPYFVSNCFNCHGTEGKFNSAIPVIAGRDKEYLLEALKGFKAGTKPATIMHQLAKGYTAEQVDALAAYFAARR